ncbi:carboxypeptidase-like protein [Pseudovirgaria hyperparasitica]|uniref:Carboxypeptidase n=1 Tax=Pseudovirgaria hyperparasitica TaxID=470096 RepID=A0A6A6VTE3_9PEZI|nr:carboxypeptidase-like protein [Pseudovirgaria hyperparasitica]KAF2753024.1 carboxypeptidase-like protein [Pseudovirgaria hyperparasitica]
MLFSTRLVALAALAGFSCADQAPSSPIKQGQKYGPRVGPSAPRAAVSSHSIEQRQVQHHLNDKTAPFAVNGSALPEVDFDIGESYAGLLPVDDSKELWFWYVPTENPDASEEILIWLNGGPGCSSLDGFFKENGPVTWMSGTYRPVKNTYAWSNLTNVVWIEQPVGTGYTQGTPNATNEVDVAAQFLPFWKNFMDLFDLHGRKIYVTGESYAGMYCPYIADAMIAENNTEYFNVEGLMIYDPSIGPDAITEQVPTLAFTEFHQNVFPFNESTVSTLKNISATCGYDDFMEQGLKFPPDGPFPSSPGLYANGSFNPDCDIFDYAFSAIFEINPCFDIYQVGQLCPLLWDVLGFPYSGFYFPPGVTEPYFNRTDVKKAINAPEHANWMICTDIDVFPNGDDSPPSGDNGGPLGRVAEHTNNVIVAHGLLDMVLISNGSLLTLNNLTWNGAQGFTTPPENDFYVPYHYDASLESVSGAGIFGKWMTDRGLTYVEIELAGHMVPQFQPAAGYRNLEFLLGRISNMSEVSSFSTQPDFKQPSFESHVELR